MNQFSSLLPAWFVLLVATSFAEADNPVYGTVTAHNGINHADGGGTAPEGSGNVNVRFQYGYVLYGPHKAIYDEVATHEVAFTYAPGPATNMWNQSYIYNRTGVSWTGFVIRVEGADFAGAHYGNAEQARAADPVVQTFSPVDADEIEFLSFLGYDISLLGSEIVRFNPKGTGFADAELSIWFDNPVADGWAFALDYNVIPSPGATTPAEFTMYLTPIPEPATAGLLVLGGLLVLQPRRARFRAPANPLANQTGRT